ncbi:RNA polymerase sigma factor [Alteribacter keqinensis]|uniref:Sigma-70 family RNA polymerase sigma factor n=1 Tax=Alteribacter keqinensis TaxID=2483800 RepID=A0A3M7TNA8_9BACI|nr:sigma-70 family RNA polymerase sigma factor [Alteribacter keqinensis]RNA66942.1 sigma-70 family RNA polymerase sigma factor [Alteribacter keqinensis]
MAIKDDKQLYRRIQEQDQAALEALYDKYEKLLFSFALKMVQHPQAAEEVVQEVMLKLWRGTGHYDDTKGKFSSWLLTMTRNTAIDQIRKQNKQEVHLTNEWEPGDSGTRVEDMIEWKEQGETLKKAIRTLKKEQIEIVELFYFKGYSQKKIAEKTNLPLGTIKGRIRLALKHLRQELSVERGTQL